MVETEKLVMFLKSKGLTCAKLTTMVGNKKSDAKMFSDAGFNSFAQKEIEQANRLESIKKQACLLH